MGFTSANQAYFADAIRRHGVGGSAADLLARYKKDTKGLDQALAFKALEGGRMFGASDRARYEKLLKSRPQPAKGKKPPKNKDPELRKKIAEIRAAVKRGEISKEQGERMIAELYQGKYGPKADLGQFKELLGNLEASKMKQQRQKSVEGRRDIFAGGLASMMANF